MEELIKNININYQDIKISKVKKIGVTTINDVFIINGSGKQYILK